MPTDKLNFRVPKDVSRALQRQAAEQGRTQSAVLLEALYEYLAARSDPDSAASLAHEVYDMRAQLDRLHSRLLEATVQASNGNGNHLATALTGGDEG